MIEKKRRHYGSMKLSKGWLVVSVVLLLLVFACASLWFISAGWLDILTLAPYGNELQNSRVIFSHDLNMVFLGTYQNEVTAVDTNGTAIWSYQTTSSIEGMAYDKTRSLLIAGVQGRMIAVLDARTGSELHVIQTPGRLFALDYDEINGQILASTPMNAAKGMICLYTVEGEELLRVNSRPARGCAFAPDGTIVYGDARSNIVKMDREGHEIASARGDTEIYALDVVWDTGDILAITDGGMLLCLDSNLQERFTTKIAGNGRTVAATHDGHIIGAGTREGDVYLLDAEGAPRFTTRLTSAISQIVINDDQSFVVPLSKELYYLDISAAESLGIRSAVHRLAPELLAVFSVLLIISLLLTFGSSRSRFIAFFISLSRHRTAYLLLLPSFALIILFNYLPVVQAFYYAFTDWNQMQTSMRDVKFIGFDNFVKMVREGYFILGVKNMVIMMMFNFLKLVVPLALAEMIFSMSSPKRKYWFRFLLVLPMVVPSVVFTLMWKNIYDPTIGLINNLLAAFGREDLMRSWLGSESTALGSIIFMGFPWVNSFAFLVFYGGLIGIPGDLFEAARVDGSNPFWNFTRIHLPLISPQIKMIFILTFINSIQDYGGVLLLTGGGPGYATYVPGYELYLNAQRLGQYGYACALGVVMFVVILAGTILNLRIKTEEALG